MQQWSSTYTNPNAFPRPHQYWKLDRREKQKGSQDLQEVSCVSENHTVPNGIRTRWSCLICLWLCARCLLTRDQSEHHECPVLETSFPYHLRAVQLLTCRNLTCGQHSIQVFFPFQFNSKETTPDFPHQARKVRGSQQQLFVSLETMTAAIHEGHKANYLSSQIGL